MSADVILREARAFLEWFLTVCVIFDVFWQWRIGQRLHELEKQQLRDRCRISVECEENRQDIRRLARDLSGDGR